jgi:hypothetical protein
LETDLAKIPLAIVNTGMEFDVIVRESPLMGAPAVLPIVGL